ncbi:zinc-dependent alcohol dehydrogenase family protein [Anoxybacterium hadale]|uniref:Zinc-dependent alcohol dehydrogenase family protein n=1 Tax=Anoxybacterium hadale TaxID=3408580 RepID=A0ACD1AFR0_9FIRM|nr:zinc-dependent alcohol dehydrogenase family protein [Clostridiales bacterium]
MKAIVYNAPRDYELKEIPRPVIKPNQVLIKVAACGVCRTDMHIHEGDFISAFPLTPGHEFTGEIAEVGSQVTELSVGDRVVGDNTVLCGECYYCRRNQPLFCENFYSLGCNGPGGYAEYVAVNHDKVFPISDNLTYDQAIFVEPLACAIHGMDVIAPKCGDDVLIFGAGPTGILLAQLLKHGGAANVVVCASSQEKLNLIQKNGYAQTVWMDRKDYSVHTNVLKEMYPQGFDIVIDATGAPEVLEQCFEFPKKTGKIVIYGVCSSDAKITISPYQIFSNELKVLGSFAQTHCFDRAVKYLENGVIKVDDLVAGHFSLKEFGDVMDVMVNGKGLLKLIVNP